MTTLFKKLAITAGFLFLSLHAQVTITTADMPVVDTVYHFHQASNAGVDFSITGPATVWDYTTLSNTGFSADSFANPAVTPFVYQVVFNNFFLPAYDATHAQPGSSIVLPNAIPFEVNTVYNFYKNTPASFSMVGFGATINGIPTPIQYQGEDRVYSFPLAYGSQDTSSYSFYIPVPTLGYWRQQGTRVNEVDGYGTLQLPNGVVYNVVRLKSSLDIVDSVHIDAIGFTLPVPRKQTDYKFMAPGEGEPVLQITTQPLFLVGGPETITSVKYKNELDLAGIPSEGMLGLKLYPNPSTHTITISNPQSLSWKKMEIISLTGQVSLRNTSGGTADITLNIEDLAPGTYTVILELSDGNSFTRTFIKQ